MVSTVSNALRHINRITAVHHLCKAKQPKVVRDCLFSRSVSSYRDVTELTVARLMVPDDANINGNVHGGTILKLMEEAGAIAAARYCNNVTNNKDPDYIQAIPTLARMEKMDFIGPMFIGEVAELDAKITYTSHRSLQVTVHVYADSLFSGDKRLTNTAHMWYVPVNMDDVRQILTVPKLNLAAQDEEIGKMAYNQQKRQRACTLLHLTDTHIGDTEPFSVGCSRTVLTTLVGPSDAFSHGYCKGGVIMKLMDECAAITASKHVRTPVVTACLDATNFLAKTRIGSVLSFHGLITYTGNKSMEIQVVVDSEQMFRKGIKKQRAVEAFFTFVSLDSKGKTLPVAPLKVKTPQEESRYEAGLERYQERQSQRRSSKQHSVT